MTADDRDPEQPGLPGLARAAARKSGGAARARRAKQAAPVVLAAVDPVARVVVDLPLAHLDRPFDYAVPASMADQAGPGVRVKVRFAGQDIDGYVVERVAATDHDGRLAPLRRIVGAEPVLTPAVAELCGRLAERYAGVAPTYDDWRCPRGTPPPRSRPLRLAPRSTRCPVAEARSVGGVPDRGGLPRHVRAGGAPARRVERGAGGGLAAATWPTWQPVTLASGRGTVICSPTIATSPGSTPPSRTSRTRPARTLQAEAGPGPRYRDFLLVSRGARRIVVGTRSAAFAPVHDLGWS